MTQEALKLALALVTMHHTDDGYAELRSKLAKEALAQEQEPVATLFGSLPVYDTTTPQRTWVGLEGEEIRNLWEEATKPDRSTMTMVTSFAKSIEAKLKQKNGYAEENT